MLVIHENRGLTDHIRSVAARLAGDGYSALAVDLLSEEGGTAALGGAGQRPAGAGRGLARATRRRHAGRPRRAGRRVPGAKLGIIGFCFGGGMVWTLLDAGEPRLAAAIPFYGPAPTAPDFSGNTAAVLGVYAELDGRVNALARRRDRGADGGRADPRDQDVPRRRPRVLQRHRRPLQRRPRRLRPTPTCSPGWAATSPPKPRALASRPRGAARSRHRRRGRGPARA